MRAFLTGGSGFIGRNLIALLRSRGGSVVCLCRREPPSTDDDVVWLRGDLAEPAGRLASKMEGCDAVLHMAARISFDRADRSELVRVNADGTERVLEAARMARVAKVVVVSSACTIGLSANADEVLDESAPFDPRLARRNSYLHSKHIAEMHALAAAERGQHVVIVNPTTVFGGGDRTMNSGTLIRQVAQARVIPVPPGGSNVVGVKDVASGILAAAERGVSGRRYILGGENLRFDGIIDIVSEVVGRSPWRVPLVSMAQIPMMGAAWLAQLVTRSRIITPQIISDTFAYKFYSSARAEAELGWRAGQCFRDSVAEAWQYYEREGLLADRGKAAA